MKRSTRLERFAKKHGTCICRDLLKGCELTTTEGQRQFKDNDLLNKVCTSCVQSAVEILEDIMELKRKHLE